MLDSHINDYGLTATKPNGYYSALARIDLPLTNINQIVSGFVDDIAPLNLTMVDGRLTFPYAGIYNFSVERIYFNYDNNPTVPIVLTIDVIKNGSEIVFNRSVITSAAKTPNEPFIYAVTSRYISDVSKDDYFEFNVRAEEGVATPADVKLHLMQVTINRMI